MLLSDEQFEITCRTQGVALLGQPQRLLRGGIGGGVSGQGLGVVVERTQHVGDFTQGLQDGLSVVGGGGIVACLGGIHFGAQA